MVTRLKYTTPAGKEKMKKYYYKNNLIGIKITEFPNGSVPHTGLKEVQEAVGVLTLKYKKGSYLKAHIHKDARRSTAHLQEAFIVKKGKVRIDLYGPDRKFFKYIYLSPGELFLAVAGGHGFRVIKDCEIFEVKNGPFEEDKVFIEQTS